MSPRPRKTYSVTLVALAIVLLTAVAPSSLPAQFLGVFPDGQALQEAMNSGPIGISFGVSGTQSNTTYFIDIFCNGSVIGCSSTIGSSFTGIRSSIPVNIWTGGVGTGRIRIKVYASGGTPSDSGWYNVTVTSPYQPPTLANAQYGWFRNMGRCVASCFDNVQSYSLPSYVSMDVARSVTLQYRSWQAHPLGTVQIDATDFSQTPADSLSLLLQRQNGTYVTFTNGSQEIFFRGGVVNGTTRLAAQFDASAQGTNDSTYIAIVKSYWRNNTVQQASLSVRIMVVNELASPYGAGWSVVGLQRVYPATDGGVVVVDGAGSASFFSGSCVPSSSCSFTSSYGDFTTLSTNNNFYTRHYPDGTTYNFTSSGLLYSVVDRFGNTTSYYFDGSNRVTLVQDPTGGSASFAYDPVTQKLSSISTGGSSYRTSTFSIDTNGDLRSASDPDNIYAFHADYSTHRLTHMVDRRGGAWDFTYAADGTMQSAQGPTINASGSQTRPMSTFSGPSTRMFAAIATGAGTATNPVTRGIDLRATVTNPRGYSTNYTLSQWGSPTLAQDALGRNETFGYDANSGQLTSHTAVNGRQTSYVWYGPQLVQITDGPSTVHIEYGETLFNQATHIYGDVTEQWMTYNTNQTGRPLLTRRLAGQGSTRYSFDAAGRLLSATDSLGHTTTWYHQPLCCGSGNTDSISRPGLLATRFSRDAYGRTVATRQPNGSTDSTYYDMINRTTATVDGSLHRTIYAYDSLYLRGVTDAKGQQYSFVRNALGWVEQATRPGSTNALMSSYDVDGNVIQTTNRQGNSVIHAIDQLDRDTLVTADGQTTRITYGGNDQFVRLINSESVDSLVADSNGRFTQINTYRPASGSNYSIAYSLGKDGLLLGLSATANRWSGTRGPSFTYDSTKNVKTLMSFAGTSTLTYNPDGLATQSQFPNGMTANWNYTRDHDIASTIYSNGSPGAWFLRDSLGRISQRSPSDFADASLYAYNADGSLAMWATSPQGGNCPFDPSYGYECFIGIPQTMATYTYDQVGNLLSGGASYTANRLMSANGYTMTYDEDGNLKTKNGPGFTQSLSWNALGQLTSVTTNGTTITFGYDGLGRRVRKSVSGGATTGYLYTGDNLLMELDGNGNPVSEYAFWPGVDAPNVLSRGGQTYYFTQDPQSSNITSIVRASDNTVQAQYDYTPFGTPRSGNFDNVGNSLQFAARQYDSETGLSYFRARYYDAQVGRFISEDPLGLAGGINPYVYASNDPINHHDPFGLDDDPQTLPPVEVDDCSPGYHMLGRTCVKDFVPPTPPRDGPPGSPNNPGSPGPGAPKNKPPSCAPTSLKPQSFGVDLGGAVEVGTGYGGASSQLTLGAGAFSDPGAGLSVAGFDSRARVLYAGSQVDADPQQISQPSVLGAYAGGGPGFFVTNAHSGQQTSGPFTTWTVNIGFGPGVSVQLAYGGGIWELNLSKFGPGMGLSVSQVTTTTTIHGNTGGCQ